MLGKSNDVVSLIAHQLPLEWLTAIGPVWLNRIGTDLAEWPSCLVQLAQFNLASS